MSDLFRMMFRHIVGGEDVVGEAPSHHDLAVVQGDAGVPEPRPPLQVGAVHPSARLLLQVQPPAVAEGRQLVVEAAVEEETALLPPSQDGGHSLPGAAHGGVVRRVVAD